ncbi:MAG: YigZ family protein [Lactobacillus sp.]|nr:YigZ family protein [Lactobacillus sp.]
MLNNYRTIQKAGVHELEIKKSRFITNMARVQSEPEAKTFLEQIKKEHYKATHHCSAYMIGPKDDIQRANDDGEPSGTAGLPMLESLKLMKLQNVIAVTTRYFGGIKLGTGGLIRAYSNSVSEAAHAIGIVEGTLQRLLQFHLAYHQIDFVLNYFKDSKYDLEDTQYGADVAVSAYIDTGDLEKVKADLIELLSGQVDFTVGPERFREVLITDKS